MTLEAARALPFVAIGKIQSRAISRCGSCGELHLCSRSRPRARPSHLTVNKRRSYEENALRAALLCGLERGDVEGRDLVGDFIGVRMVCVQIREHDHGQMIIG